MPLTLGKALRQSTARGTKPTTPWSYTPPGGRQLLSSVDFTYDGYYGIPDTLTVPGNSGFGSAQSLTHRYVGEQLRFFFQPFVGGYYLVEMKLPSGGIGSDFSDADCTGVWDDIYDGDFSAQYQGIKWDPVNENLIHTKGTEYPIAGSPSVYAGGYFTIWTLAAPNYPTQSSVDNDARYYYLSNEGAPGFSNDNLGSRRTYGGCMFAPAWFLTANPTVPGRRILGFGGYSSLATAQGGTSFGLSLYAVADDIESITGIDEGAYFTVPVPAADYLELSYHDVGAACWYPDPGAPDTDTKDYGRRNNDLVNYFFDPEQAANPEGRPEVPPSEDAVWLADECPDGGYGRWTYIDSYMMTGNWVDNDAGTRTRHGILAVATTACGYAYYAGSVIYSDYRRAEIHLFDPDDLAAVIDETMENWEIQPYEIIDITSILQAGPFSDALGLGGAAAGTPGGAYGATFDPTTNKLYVACWGCGLGNGYRAAIHVWSVGGS